MNNIVYVYNKKRCNFGRQPLFTKTPVGLVDSINPNPTLQKENGLRNPVHHECQVYIPKAEHEVNTIRVDCTAHGINHTEGGWPKEIHHDNEEETLRYRRRIERDDSYINAIKTLAPKFESCINQNNAIELYEHYFKDVPKIKAEDPPTVKTANIYRDANKRPVSSLCWTKEDDPKLAVAYCNKQYPVSEPINQDLVCGVWSLENSEYPASEFLPPDACWQIDCSPENPAIIVGGLENGRVCVFDVRAQKFPISISPIHLAHRDPVTVLIYQESRLNNEFFTGSSDGQCMWYDIRDISQPVDTLIIDVKVPTDGDAIVSNAEGVSALHYDRSFPTKFMCGTETGLVINVNRKGRTQQEIMSVIFKAHLGPVRAVHRSHCSSKMFITCGDWTAHIWSDEIKSCPIITGMPHYTQVMDVAWAPYRYSGYMTVTLDGKLHYWDLLRRYNEPVVSVPVSRYPLLKVVPHENGRQVALGGKLGSIFLTVLSESLVTPGNTDKTSVLQIFDREARREHILENRVKEIRLKFKMDEEKAATNDMLTPSKTLIDEEIRVLNAEEEYRKQVLDEIRRAGIPPSVLATQDTSLRNR